MTVLVLEAGAPHGCHNLSGILGSSESTGLTYSPSSSADPASSSQWVQWDPGLDPALGSVLGAQRQTSSLVGGQIYQKITVKMIIETLLSAVETLWRTQRTLPSRREEGQVRVG